ncbi:MAG: hypothetical protein NTY09_08340 [bacterium]|nr:hypothetical protein [bacterium]
MPKSSTRAKNAVKKLDKPAIKEGFSANRKIIQSNGKKARQTSSGSAIEYNDLCTTCNNPPVCDSTRAGRRPVYFCEQFDDYKKPGEAQRPGSPAKKSKVISEPEPPMEQIQAAGEKYTGICKNCDLRETCMNACAEGGIWHCEEYC